MIQFILPFPHLLGTNELDDEAGSGNLTGSGLICLIHYKIHPGKLPMEERLANVNSPLKKTSSGMP